MTDGPLRVGLIGAGGIAQIAQLPALGAAEGVTIAGVVTASDEETRRNLARWPIERGYATAEEMIEHAGLDAVFVLTRKHMHTPFVKLALDASLDVFCEKPLATSVAEAQEVAAAAAASSQIVMVGFNRRYAEVYRHAHDRFAERPPRFVVAQKSRRGSEYRATLENGIHMVDLLRWFCGEAIDVVAMSSGDDRYQEDGACALIRFDSGAVATFAAVRTAGEWDERLEAYGDFTTVRVIAPDTSSISQDGVTTTIEQRPRANGWVDVTTSAGFGPAVDHFLDCVRSRRQPLTNAWEAWQSQALMDRILSAAGLPIIDQDEIEAFRS
jgi:virulence factor